jgi:hypothetical protein
VQQTGQQVDTTSQAATATLESTSPVLVDTLREVGSLSGNINRLLRALGGSLLLDLAEPEAKPGTETRPGARSDADAPAPPSPPASPQEQPSGTGAPAAPAAAPAEPAVIPGRG